MSTATATESDLGAGMVVGSAGSPLIRSLALLAGVYTYLFFLTGSVVLWRLGGGVGRLATSSDASPPVQARP